MIPPPWCGQAEAKAERTRRARAVIDRRPESPRKAARHDPPAEQPVTATTRTRPHPRPHPS